LELLAPGKIKEQKINKEKKMIYAITSGRLTPGWEGDPWKFAKKYAKYVKENYPDTNNELLGNISGAWLAVYWKSKHESLGAFQEFDKKLWEEEGWKSIMEEQGKAEKEKGTIFFNDMETNFYNIEDI